MGCTTLTDCSSADADEDCHKDDFKAGGMAQGLLRPCGRRGRAERCRGPLKGVAWCGEAEIAGLGAEEQHFGAPGRHGAHVPDPRCSPQRVAALRCFGGLNRLFCNKPPRETSALDPGFVIYRGVGRLREIDSWLEA